MNDDVKNVDKELKEAVMMEYPQLTEEQAMGLANAYAKTNANKCLELKEKLRAKKASIKNG